MVWISTIPPSVSQNVIIKQRASEKLTAFGVGHSLIKSSVSNSIFEQLRIMISMTGWYITTNDITNWTETDKRRAEETLPLLVEKLILASCKPKQIDFPSGDNIAIGGWDGILEVDIDNRFIPSGLSGWECGTNKDVKSKADGDYQKRLDNPSPFQLKETTFVSVTSRLWTQKNKWIQEKKLENKWKDVRVIDAETLSNWLEECPAVHRWFAGLLGKRCPNIYDLDQAWTQFSSQTQINLTQEFLLHGRENESDQLLDLISNNNKYTIQSNSKKEAYGFILATLLRDEKAKCRCLVIKSQKDWDYMAYSDQSLILIPYEFSPDRIGYATQKGHTVLIPMDDQDNPLDPISLPRQSRPDREDGLKKLFSDDDEKREEKAILLYEDTKGFFDPLLRHDLLTPIDYQQPIWIQETLPDVLFAVLFASAWRENNQHDCEVMEILSGLNYSEFQKQLSRLSKQPDPPIRQVGEVWQVIAKMDLWSLIATKIDKLYLDRLGEIVPRILTDEDPSYDLPPNQRYMSSFLEPKYSPLLKKGIADSLVLLSVLGDRYCKLWANKPSDLVRGWIYGVFNNNKQIKFWFSIQGYLTLIAEAAPGIFLSSVESILKDDHPIFLELFKQEGDGILGGGCYHTDLLWALELISWDQEYLSRVSLCLARLSEIDPGGRYRNRPFNSLRDIYLGWINNTSATHDERIKILRHVLIPKYPKVAWCLMIELRIKPHNDYTMGICKPKYREWGKTIERGTTVYNYRKYVGEIINLLLQEAERTRESGIVDLIDGFNFYTQEQRQELIELMLDIKVEELSDEKREKIINELREILSKHRIFSYTKWAWSEDLLNQLEKVYHHFNFKDLVKANAFLFDSVWPPLINPFKKEIDCQDREMDKVEGLINRDTLSCEEKEALYCQKRVSVFESIYQDRGIDGVQDLIDQCPKPYFVGYTAFVSSYSDCFYDRAIEWLDGDDNLEKFAIGYLEKFVRKDYEKAKQLLIDNQEWSAIKKAKWLLLMIYPLTPEKLQLVANIPEEGRKYFWSKLSDFVTKDQSGETVSLIASKLLEHNRPLAAIDVIFRVIHSEKDLKDLDNQLIFNVLIKIATSPNNSNESQSFDHYIYYIVTAIKYLQDAGTIPEQEMLILEWRYLNFFKYDQQFSPRYLMKKIAEDPAFFTQLVSWRFIRDDSQEGSIEKLPDYLIQQRREITYNLLKRLSILPGQQGDTIDENVLLEWVKQTREYLTEVELLPIGDEIIGQYLSRCPQDKDGIWPHQSVRMIIEEVESEDLERELFYGRRNARGVTCRGIYEGGKQERLLAEKYNSDAESLQLIWPRTADLLRAIARRYQQDAEGYDRRVETGSF